MDSKNHEMKVEKEDGSFHEGEFHGHHGFERSSLEAKLISTGFKIMSYEVCYTLTRETEEGTREYPLFLLIAKKA